MADQERRRKRATISCSLCRKRKIRCNRELPCSNCAKSRDGICVYSDAPYSSGQNGERGSRAVQYGSSSRSQNSIIITQGPSTEHHSTSMLANSTPASTYDSHLAREAVEPAKGRSKASGGHMTKVSQESRGKTSAATPSMEITTSRLTEPFHVYHQSPTDGFPHPVVRGVMHKTRFFGKSNWINGVTLFLETIEAINASDREEALTAITNMQKCKSLGKAIKAQREPEWPTPPTTALPSKEVADELVDRYLHTFETVYRVLHIPSFMRDYESLWTSTREENSAFLVQLKLILAIGATTFDERFSLRASAMRWVYEAQSWLAAPEFKSRLSISALQISILLSMAREAVGVGANLVWVSMGSVLRTAVHMGLHRDPEHLQITSVFAIELRRRLWNTILELDLLSSLTSGSPPLISLADFDTQPPRNLDDDQLEAEDPVPKQEDEFTRVAVAIALRKSFPTRLAVIKFLNDLSSQGAYDETLRLDTQLRAVYKSLRQALQRFGAHSEPSSVSFELGFVDIHIHRFISALHVPFFGPSLQESKYAFSRRVVIESSLKVWCTAYPASAIKQLSRGQFATPNTDQLPRLAICGSGFLRTTIMQACFLIAVELRSQMQEDDSLGPVPIRTDLLSVFEDSKAWSAKCIEAGETNVKGHLLLCVVGAHMEALMQGVEERNLSARLIKAMDEVGERCLKMLEEVAARDQVERNDGMLDRMSSNIQVELTEDWDFMLSDDIFNLGSYGLILD